MENHLHKILNLTKEDVIKITLNHPANVFLMDEENYSKYIKEYNYDYFGTLAEESPFLMAPPAPGLWHLVIFRVDPVEDLTINVEIIQER